MTNNSTNGLTSLFSRNVTHGPLRDFTCIAPLACTANALSVNASPLIRSVANLVARARSGPEGVQVGTFGIARTAISGSSCNGSAPDSIRVPFRDSRTRPPTAPPGHVPAVIGMRPTAQEAAREGCVRILSVTDPRRAPTSPEVPAIGGMIGGFGVLPVNFALIDPAGLLEPIVAKLNAAAKEALANPRSRARFADATVQPLGGPL